MSLFRLQVAITLILILGHATVLIHKKDIFPFSAYPMYSEVFSSRFIRTYKVIGIDQKDNKTEINIHNYFPDFWQALFLESLLRDLNVNSVCSKLKSVIKIHEMLNDITIKSAQVIHLEYDPEILKQHLMKEGLNAAPFTTSRVIYDCSI